MTIKIIRCKYCKENVKTGFIHDCKDGRRQASYEDHYYDGSCLIGSVLGDGFLSQVGSDCSSSEDLSCSWSE